MGDYWWLLLIGGPMWAVLLTCCYLGWRHPEKCTGCPICGHEAGLDGAHCSDVDHYNGWSSEWCRCQNDYHWRYESA